MNPLIQPQPDQLLLVSPDDLHNHWEFVRKGLLKISDSATDGWMPEDVYMSLKLGESRLFVSPQGFVVVKPLTDFRGPKLFIWAAYCLEGNAIQKYEPDIIKIAKQIGAKRIAFESTRRGWEKFYTPCMTTFEKEV